MEQGLFTTAGGIELSAVTAAEMRDVDRVAVEDVGLRLLSMMENAGRNLATSLRRGGAETVVVYAGSGGNGGGGLVAARHLANAGTDVTVVLADISIPAEVYRRLEIPYERPFEDDYCVELDTVA